MILLEESGWLRVLGPALPAPWCCLEDEDTVAQWPTSDQLNKIIRPWVLFPAWVN